MRLPESLQQYRTFGLTWSLVALGHLATEIAIGAGEVPVWSIVIWFTGSLLLITGLCWRSLSQHWRPGGMVTLLAITAMLGPFLLAPLRTAVWGTGQAFEINLLIGFRNVSLICLIWSSAVRLERIAVLTSLFTLLFCVSTTTDFSLIPICILYLLMGVAWLCTKYWSQLKTDSVVGSQETAPWFLLTTATLLMVAMLFLFAVPEEARSRMVEGFMPSSGGTGNYDPYARSGVGDGDALVAATKEALSFAPIENAPFIEGQEPSLYDVFQDTYGETKPPQKMERAIALPPELFQPNHHRMAEAKKSSKTFSLERESPQNGKHRHVKDTASAALFHLVGRVPAHLRYSVYDLFDGYEWYPQEINDQHQQKLTLCTVGDKPWIRLPDGNRFESTLQVEPHALRIMNVKTNVVPAPTNLQGLHIDRCDRVDMFRWAQDGIVAMDRESLPSMTVIHLRSGIVDETRLQGSSATYHAGFPEYRALPTGTGMEAIRACALEWTAGLKTDLERIAAIRQRLKKEYFHQPDVTVPTGCDNPAHWFLFESKQGPDYLFATSAVLLLRSLGISCRAVSGLYANPENYDLSARQTSVFPGDAHWWAEVYLGSGTWLTLETTPGFETLAPVRSWGAQLWILLQWSSRRMIEYWPITLLMTALISVAMVFHRHWRANLLTWWWKICYARRLTEQDLRPLILDAGTVFDRKLQLARTPRPQGKSFRRFLQETSPDTPQWKLSAESALLFSNLYDWAAYDKQSTPPLVVPVRQVRQLCCQLLDSTQVQSRSRIPSETRQKA